MVDGKVNFYLNYMLDYDNFLFNYSLKIWVEVEIDFFVNYVRLFFVKI